MAVWEPQESHALYSVATVLDSPENLVKEAPKCTHREHNHICVLKPGGVFVCLVTILVTMIHPSKDRARTYLELKH